VHFPHLPERLPGREPTWFESTDVVVVGSGIAGLTAALHLREAGLHVTVVTKVNIDDGSTRWAQGGIAAVLGPFDTPAAHAEDTMVAGVGLCDPAAVRVLVMIPWSLSQVMVAITFGWLFNSQFGALNGLLYQLGIIGKYQFWFADGFRALNFLGVAFVWSLVPFATLLFLGALQTVPPELHQAAKVDGANVFRRFYHVTLPWIQPTMLVVLIVATLNGFLAFALIYLITAGGPGESTTVLSWWGYSTTFRARDVGKGAAIFYLLTFIIFGLSALYIRLFMRHDEQLST